MLSLRSGGLVVLALAAIAVFLTMAPEETETTLSGSTYNALLVLAETDYRILPSVALSCNLIVVTGGVFQYRRSGDLSLLDRDPPQGQQAA